MKEITGPLTPSQREELTNVLQNTDEHEFWTIKQVSAYLHVPVKTIYSLVQNDQIPYLKPFRILLFRKPDIVKYLFEKDEKHKARRKLKKMKFSYLDYEGKKVAILWRNEGSNTTEECPFCNKHHIHSKGEGMRTAHCSYPANWTQHVITHPDGTNLYRPDGYFIKTIKAKASTK